MKISVVGVVGAGVMGAGVAQVLAQSNFRVLLIDLNRAQVEKAEAEIRRNVALQNMFKKSGGQVSVDKVMMNITGSNDYDLLHEADFVIENVTEKWETKREVYAVLDSTCRPATIFAANTSAIPITRIASLTRRAPQVIGMHLMNPVPMKHTIEFIRGFHTSAETLAAAKELVAGMGKDCVVVNDSPGFVSNRVLMLMVNEAIFLVHEQVAPPEDVDRIFRECFGHKMGPLETADLIGLDTILYSIEVLYDNFNDSKYRPCPLLRKMVDAGFHGRKNGRGFYVYA
jgi:3-hydroxybutyryl-CoA dehydrogenase